jgi:hypothetical protein
MTAWNPKLHPRDGENGRFTRNWEARLAEQLAAASKRRQNFKPDTGRPSNAQPYARQLGYVRVGDHPTRMGAVGGEESYFGTSAHPDAGGVWVDPARPGTQVAPTFRNDYGSAIMALAKPASRTEQRKHDVRSRRSDDWSRVPADRERRQPEDGGKIGRRLDGAPEAAVKEMRRAQARARVEASARRVKRRTPRGTQVDSWMDKVNDRIGRSGG